MEQPLKKYGKRVSILGLWQPGQSFEYALAQGGSNSQSYIKFMDGVAHKAPRTLAETGRYCRRQRQWLPAYVRFTTLVLLNSLDEQHSDGK